MKFIDLTHSLTNDIPFWDGDCGFSLSVVTDYTDCTPPDLFRTQRVNMPVGLGTHMDSPAHVSPGAKTIDQLELHDLVIDCIVISISDASEDFVATPELVEQFEKEHGKIPEHSFVIFNFGWNKRWPDIETYRNNFTFPTVHESTAKLLLERNIAGLGVDTLSADNGSAGFPVHRAILGAGKYLVENVANLDEVPPMGAKIMVMPIKIKDGTEAPIRLVAMM